MKPLFLLLTAALANASYNRSAATDCVQGYTSQYPHLNALHQKYAPMNFTVLAVPSNQFGLQEPASKIEILKGLEFVRPGNGFKPSFPMTNKIDINGDNGHDLYKFLKLACPTSPQSGFSKKNRLNYDTLHASDIRWNFEKILVGRNGKPMRRYHASVTPGELWQDIEWALRL